MANNNLNNLDLFIEKSKLLSIYINEFENIEQAFTHIIQLCKNKDFCEIISTDTKNNNSDTLLVNETSSFAEIKRREKKIINASVLQDLEKRFGINTYEKFSTLCKTNDIECITDEISNYLGGIDIGLSFAECAVAASGTCLVNCANEEIRLASMISEINIIFLEKSKIYQSLDDISDFMEQLLSSDEAQCITFISGASRTSDIERILTIGAHGPLEMHVVLLDNLAV